MVAKFSEELAAYRLDQERRGLSPRTIYRRATDLRGFNLWLQPRSALEATEDDVQRFLDGKRLAARTRYCWLSNLHSFYVFEMKRKKVRHDPTADIMRPKLPRNLPRPIAESDLAYGLEVAGTVMRAWLVLGAYAGLRCSEIARLTRADVLDADGLLRIVGKGNVERLIPIHPEVMQALKVAGLPRTGHLFRRPRGGRFPDAMVSREIAVFFDELDIDATAHQLRHYFGTNVYRACKDLRVTQELLGHASPTTTAIYTAFSRKDAASAVLALGMPKAS